MAANVHSMHIREITHLITLRVRGLRSFGIRFKIARWCFLLGASIAGIGIVIEHGEADLQD